MKHISKSILCVALGSILGAVFFVNTANAAIVIENAPYASERQPDYSNSGYRAAIFKFNPNQYTGASTTIRRIWVLLDPMGQYADGETGSFAFDNGAIPHCSFGHLFTTSELSLSQPRLYSFDGDGEGCDMTVSDHIIDFQTLTTRAGIDYPMLFQTGDNIAQQHFTNSADGGNDKDWYYSATDDYDPVEIVGTQSGATDKTTHIISFTPEEGTTTSNPVQFSLSAYVSPDDVGDVLRVEVKLHNIDQNVLILGSLSPSDIVLYDENISAGGLISFATSTLLGEGNYRVEASMKRNFLGVGAGFTIDEESHQFIVGSSTFIGAISQNLFSDTQQFFASSTATSSTALASSCNPLSGVFDTRNCLAFLFVPDPNALIITAKNFKEQILTRFPWGYATRFVAILSGKNTTPLPAFTVNIKTGPSASTALAFNPADMLAGGASLLESVKDPIHNKSARDIFEPFIKFTFAIAILFYIVNDITGQEHMNAGGHSVRIKRTY